MTRISKLLKKSGGMPTKLPGHPGWWRYESYSHVDYRYFDPHIIGRNAESKFFISHGKTRAHQMATGGYLYMIFEAGGHPSGCAAPHGGADTLDGAIRKADALRRKKQ